MTAAQYARTACTTMGHANEQLIKDYKDKKLRFHHDALVIGYTSVNCNEFASYDGRFGKGLAVFINFNTRYSRVFYYLEV